MTAPHAAEETPDIICECPWDCGSGRVLATFWTFIFNNTNNYYYISTDGFGEFWISLILHLTTRLCKQQIFAEEIKNIFLILNGK